MTTYAENRQRIKGLWPNATIPQQLADLFAERLEKLDQEILAEAIKAARIDSKFPTPELRDILTSYERQRRLCEVSKPQPKTHEPKVRLPDIDRDTQRKVVQDARSLIRDATAADAESIRNAIWSRWEAGEIDSACTSGLLAELHSHLTGTTGMRIINRDGADVPAKPYAECPF